ncbi:antibiotic biosynthesis monooxygenase [Streptosporangium saharense]|uniref:antibiotic biosynthesis monooxygenase n=1 Tax=Streptosporangium saharense TaxID=1706840 RepID=UPI003438071C
MSVVRSHRYRVAEGDLEEFLARRSSLIATVREGHPGLTHAVLVRLEDGTYTDTWHWESDAQLGAALAAISTFPEAPLTMALTRDATALNGRVVDER